MSRQKVMKNNPMFTESEPVATTTPEPQKQITQAVTEPSETKKLGRPKRDDLIRDGVQKGLSDEWTRASFIVRVDMLQKLKDYAYTERITIRDALDKALVMMLKDKKNLLPYRKALH